MLVPMLEDEQYERQYAAGQAGSPVEVDIAAIEAADEAAGRDMAETALEDHPKYPDSMRLAIARALSGTRDDKMLEARLGASGAYRDPLGSLLT